MCFNPNAYIQNVQESQGGNAYDVYLNDGFVGSVANNASDPYYDQVQSYIARTTPQNPEDPRPSPAPAVTREPEGSGGRDAPAPGGSGPGAAQTPGSIADSVSSILGGAAAPSLSAPTTEGMATMMSAQPTPVAQTVSSIMTSPPAASSAASAGPAGGGADSKPTGPKGAMETKQSPQAVSSRFAELNRNIAGLGFGTPGSMSLSSISGQRPAAGAPRGGQGGQGGGNVGGGSAGRGVSDHSHGGRAGNDRK